MGVLLEHILHCRNVVGELWHVDKDHVRCEYRLMVSDCSRSIYRDVDDVCMAALLKVRSSSGLLCLFVP